MQICGVPTWPCITLWSHTHNVLLIYELVQAACVTSAGVPEHSSGWDWKLCVGAVIVHLLSVSDAQALVH